MKKYAIVTDATSAGFIFPKWYDYYSSQFGGENIYICTYKDGLNQFKSYELGHVKIIAHEYDDDIRAYKINELVEKLLEFYEIVIRVDIDEFLVPEDTSYTNLKEFLDKWNGPYITAKGFDIFEKVGDKKINYELNLLTQRKYAYSLSAMCKTAVTRLPLTWKRGFHYASIPPKFDGLLLFHLKRLSIDMQLEWYDFMIKTSTGNKFVNDYYRRTKSAIHDFHKSRSVKKILNMNDKEISDFYNDFIENVQFDKKSKFFVGKSKFSNYNIMIPDTYNKYF